MMNLYKPKLDRTAKKVGLFCNARDEPRIKEWVVHHLELGFDTIYLFDHRSKIPIKNILTETQGTSVDKIHDKHTKYTVIVERIDYDHSNLKLVLMNRAIQLAIRFGLDWFIYMDADEFLILSDTFRDVKHFLNTYVRSDLVAVNWVMFGTSGHIQEPSGLIMENYLQSEPSLNLHVKSFVRPQEALRSVNPHYYHTRHPHKMVGVNFRPLISPYYFHKVYTPIHQTNAYIAHYVYQSEETYKRRKLSLPADDGSRRVNLLAELHQRFNDQVNLQPQKYVEIVKKNMSRPIVVIEPPNRVLH